MTISQKNKHIQSAKHIRTKKAMTASAQGQWAFELNLLKMMMINSSERERGIALIVSAQRGGEPVINLFPRHLSNTQIHKYKYTYIK